MRYPREIARIFAYKFRPENLYRYELRHLKRREDKDRDENITIENGVMKLKQATGTLRDFGSTWDICSKSFIDYCMICPTLPHVLLLYYTKFVNSAKLTSGRRQFFSLQLTITPKLPLEITQMLKPGPWQKTGSMYCSSTHVLAASSTPKKCSATTSLLQGPAAKKGTGEVCRYFDTGGCTYKKCTREPKCSEYNSKVHESHVGPKPMQV